MEAYDQGAYLKNVNQRMPKSKVGRQCLRAFWTGGLICCIGQLVSDAGKLWFGLNLDEAASFTAIVMVFLGALLTGIGIYDRIGSYAGAGSVVPITGFANSVVAPAIEFKPEGFVLGVAAKMFTIAGPVLVYGIITSIMVGLLYLIFGG